MIRFIARLYVIIANPAQRGVIVMTWHAFLINGPFSGKSS